MRTRWIILAGVGVGVLAWAADRYGVPLVRELVDELVILTSTDEQRLQQLEPDTQAKVRQLLQVLANRGIRVRVGQTLRTPAEVRATIEAGTSGVAKHSWHELGRAVDLYPYNPDTGEPDLDGVRDDLFIEMHQAGAALGLRNIAYDENWDRKYITTKKGKVWDGGHVENWGPYASKAEAFAAEGVA